MKKNPKCSANSEVTLTQMVLPFMANRAGNMHGGEVMKIMDSAAGVVAARHSRSNVVTASVTQLSFTEPIFIGDLVICHAELRYTGSTSMEVFVSVEAENIENGEIKRVSQGYFFMVALDRNGRPAKVPPLLIESEEQQKCYNEAKERLDKMKCQKVTN